jgi:hypothetical protein
VQREVTAEVAADVVAAAATEDDSVPSTETGKLEAWPFWDPSQWIVHLSAAKYWFCGTSLGAWVR